MIKISDIAEASMILNYYSSEMSMDFVPASFPNGMPNHPSRLYLSVEVSEAVDDIDSAKLKALGWRQECDGAFWVLYSDARKTP